MVGTLKKNPDHIYLKGHETFKNSEINVSTLTATDAGVGFLVNIDGLTIFHSGDHELYRGRKGDFIKEVDYISKKTDNCDICFDVGRKHDGFYIIKKLAPKIRFPMHGGMYQRNATEAKRKYPLIKSLYAKNRGDSFFYKKKPK